MENEDRERIERDIDRAHSFLESVEGLNVPQPRDRLDRLSADGLAALIAAALDAGTTPHGVRTTLLLAPGLMTGLAKIAREGRLKSMS
jgi:hypothetical protein